VKIKSLAAEAKIIRDEVRRQGDPQIKNALSEHRKGIVRSEARLAQLAYAFFRGVPYKAVEPKCAHPVLLSQLVKQCKRMKWTASEGDIGEWYGA
jgi:hypothetical protein